MLLSLSFRMLTVLPGSVGASSVNITFLCSHTTIFINITFFAWDFFETEFVFKTIWIRKIFTKSVNISDIMVYLAMFSTTIDNILCFWVLIRWKCVIILLVFGALCNLGLFWFPKTPLILNFSQLKLGTFWIFGRTPPPPIWTVSQVSPLFSLESFPKAKKLVEFRKKSKTSKMI